MVLLVPSVMSRTPRDESTPPRFGYVEFGLGETIPKSPRGFAVVHGAMLGPTEAK